jgi:hypothetical protein
MAQPKTLTEAREVLAAALERESALQAELAAFANVRAEFETQLIEKQKLVEGLDITNKDLTAQICQLQEECAGLRTAATLAETKVTEAVASLGVPPVAISEAPISAPTKAELWAEYHKLPIENRNAFYKANRDAMRD